MYDFLRFVPDNLLDLGFKSYVFMSEKPGFCGRIVRADTPEELRRKLRRTGRKAIVGVLTSNESVWREAVMRRRVDMLLDSEERQLDYATLKLAAEKDVTIELGLSKFIRTKGLRRMALFERLKKEIEVIKKFDVPFVVSSAAESIYEVRTRKQIETFFAHSGCDILRAREFAERLIRRYYDNNYIMDGFEVEAELKDYTKKRGQQKV